MVQTLISVDLSKEVKDQKKTAFHNRYHPDIPPIVTVKSNQVFRIECFDALAQNIKNDDNAADIDLVNVDIAHVISGPIKVEGAEPGDLIEVEMLDIQPLPNSEWGYTALFKNEKGGGNNFLLKSVETSKCIWDIEGIFASSRHLPGIRFPGIIHTGILATAPSNELLEEWTKREQKLIDENPNKGLACPPTDNLSIVGQLEGTPLGEKVKKEGARTIPPRENGGNCDIKNIHKGSKVWLPVFVQGANLSVGDIHFSEGDGEIAFCGGIEINGAVTMKIKVIKNGMEDMAVKTPIFVNSPVEPRFTKYLTFEGLSLDENGKQLYLDATASFRMACKNAMEYLKKIGYTEEQAIVILSAAPCESRIASIVDIPNCCCTIAIPLDIFEFDIMPKEGGFKKRDFGNLAKVIK